MSDVLEIPPLPIRPSALRIGVIGAGGIVRDAHLPGYQRHGLHVSAIADVRVEAARELARRFGIGVVCEDARELLRRDDVDVVDLAIPEHGRAAVLDAVLEARKPLLLQKPLAYSFAEARRLVERFAEAEIPLAVNQNLRFAPESQAARHLIARGVLGQVFDLRWTMRWTADSRPWARDAWYARDARFQILSWSIHHLDLFRFLLSQEPEAVYCALPRAPAQRFRGDILASAILRFPGGTQATMIDSNAATPGRPEFQELDIDGTEGSLWLRLSEPRDFQFWLRREMPADGENAPAHPIHFDTVWYPDGFAGAMSEFLQALEQNREPTISGRDNLHTMALVEACYRSGEERREVAVEEVFGG